MIDFKRFYTPKGFMCLLWFLGVVLFALSPVCLATLIGLLGCLTMFVRHSISVCSTSLAEKKGYVKYKLQCCQRRINWLDHWCCEYRRQEDDMEAEMNQWQSKLNEIMETTNAKI